MSNQAAVQAPEAIVSNVKEKGKGGRPLDPKSDTSLAKGILAGLTPEQFNKTYAVKRLVDELQCKESSAMTYFYTFKAAKAKADKATQDATPTAMQE